LANNDGGYEHGFTDDFLFQLGMRASTEDPESSSWGSNLAIGSAA
jgi:hypothetical protein